MASARCGLCTLIRPTFCCIFRPSFSSHVLLSSSICVYIRGSVQCTLQSVGMSDGAKLRETDHPKWAVAALALFARQATPLFIRTFTSSREVLSHPDAAACANLYVGEEDVVRLHLLLFSSLDRCDEIVQEWQNQNRQQEQKQKPSPGSPNGKSSTPMGGVRLSAGSDVRFVGKLMRNHMFTSYGFQSASGIRTIMAIVGDAPLDAVMPLCRSTYEASSATLCNPFRTPRMHAQLLQRWQKEVPHEAILPATYAENLRAAPTPETMTEEPSLAYSRGFREQLQTIIGPFTVTARSSIV